MPVQIRLTGGAVIECELLNKGSDDITDLLARRADLVLVQAIEGDLFYLPPRLVESILPEFLAPPGLAPPARPAND
ncbi:MAG: hypothetical protein AB7O57_01355 [Hyphomicrobiaceae bacterium]